MSLEDERPGSAADVEMRAAHAKRVAEALRRALGGDAA